MQIGTGIYSMSQDKGGHVHAFLLDNGDGLTLIDTLYDDDASVVLDEIRLIGCTPRDLKHIVLTHAHKSHLGGLAALKKASDAVVYSHAWEVDVIAGRRPATRVGLFPRRPLEAYKLQLGLALGLSRSVPCEVDRSVKAAERIGPLEVVETPGHTPGSLSFWWPERRALFAGDVIATWPELAPGWPGLTLDNAQNLRSARQLTDFGNAEILGIGHGDPIVGDAAMRIKAIVQ